MIYFLPKVRHNLQVPHDLLVLGHGVLLVGDPVAETGLCLLQDCHPGSLPGPAPDAQALPDGLPVPVAQLVEGAPGGAGVAVVLGAEGDGARLPDRGGVGAAFVGRHLNEI